MNPLQITAMTIFHPMDGFLLIKADRDHFSYIPPIVISILFAVVRIVSMYLIHYSCPGYVDPYQVNATLEVTMLVAPVVSWIVVHYAVTTISSGECKMREIYAGLAYSFVPYIVLTIPIALLSHLYSSSSAGIITTLQGLVWAYCFFQVFLSIMSMNDFTLGKTIGVIVVTIVGIVLCWVLILLLYGLTGQLINIVVQILVEFVNIYIR